jgi:hypothetical protein
LLIVFVFAAIVAIMLYREMPVAAFEARRQKEELLIDRGNEYKHAIKIYVKKIGQFPGSIDALENTNRMRFLRHKFDDPITGKNDWRLLHAGPNGIILDSKIPNTNVAPGSNAAAPGSSGTPQAPASDSFSTIFSSPSNNSGAANGGPTIAAVPQRAPAVAATGSGNPSASEPEGGEPVQTDPNAPVPAPNPQIAGTSNDPGSQMRGLVGNQNPLPAQTGNSQPGAATPGAWNAPPSSGSSSFGSSSSGSSSFGSNQASGTGAAGNTTSGGSSFGGSTFGQGTTGKIANGGTAIAGVASIAVGKTIKTVNEQSDFSLWEFYYDMAKDASATMAGALKGNTTVTGTGQSATQAAPTNNGSSFGNSSFGGSSFSGNSGSSFGSSSFGGSSATTPSQTPVTPITPPSPIQPQNQ